MTLDETLASCRKLDPTARIIDITFSSGRANMTLPGVSYADFKTALHDRIVVPTPVSALVALSGGVPYSNLVLRSISPQFVGSWYIGFATDTVLFTHNPRFELGKCRPGRLGALSRSTPVLTLVVTPR